MRSDPDKFELIPIGHVVSDREEPEDDHWDRVESRIELDPGRFGPEALDGIDSFSHVEVVFLMDRVDPSKEVEGARHPRGREDWPAVGIFAQRAKSRPNRIGLTVCRLLARDGLTLRLEGLDAIDGTPVLDIKPWVEQFGPRGPVHQAAWMDELMDRYWS